MLIEAGLRNYASLKGRLPVRNNSTDTDSLSMPTYMDANAVQARVIAATAEGRLQSTTGRRIKRNLRMKATTYQRPS